LDVNLDDFDILEIPHVWNLYLLDLSHVPGFKRGEGWVFLDRACICESRL